MPKKDRVRTIKQHEANLYYEKIDADKYEKRRVARNKKLAGVMDTDVASPAAPSTPQAEGLESKTTQTVTMKPRTHKKSLKSKLNKKIQKQQETRARQESTMDLA
eukprot:gnl/Hemi2/25086_TR8442_c0_g2_i1.p1 gnl/Hemi2/25086_TR8442_c0_g2~~gnl/Hemi2/25086_TR8442_c0_g2_i1.p1  ORF type:complete len:105 (-),score=21.00 gnl/Hemi2/25086_TR8442_c0_g2_i1:97-411(-)